MNEWAIAGIVVMIISGGWGIVKAVSGVIQPLTVEITKLNDSIKSIIKDMAELTERNSKTHDRMFKEIEAHDKRLNDQDRRILMLEEHEKKRMTE